MGKTLHTILKFISFKEFKITKESKVSFFTHLLCMYKQFTFLTILVQILVPYLNSNEGYGEYSYLYQLKLSYIYFEF